MVKSKKSKVKKKEITLESRDDGKIGSMTTEALIEKLTKEISQKINRKNKIITHN